MGGKETSGSAYSPQRAPRPPRAPIPRPPLSIRLAASGWRETIERWARTSRLVDWLYLSGCAVALLLAGCILAYG
jgi:hypothetical protein